MNLYEILNEIEESVDENGEVLDPERLEQLNIEYETKLENLCLWYKNLIADAVAYKAEKDAFAEKQKKAENKAESIKNYVDSVLAGSNFKTNRADVSYRKSEGVKITCPITEIPDEYVKHKMPEPDKVEIKKALKSGEHIDGCYLETRNNITIK